MARTGWSVDGRRIEYLGREAGLSIDGLKDEECRVKHSRPDFEFFVAGRRLVLKTIGDGTGELWSRGLLIPPTQAPATHARAACARCGVLFCGECEAPEGTHCVTCLPTISEADETRQVLEAAGPAQALALFGGLAGQVR